MTAIIWAILIPAIILRFFLSFLPAFNIDMSAWYAWADRLVNFGFGRFYDPQIWTHYTPGYLYILWLLGLIKKFFHLIDPRLLWQLFKLPSNLADIITAILLYKILLKKSKKWAFLGLIFYLFNPALIFNSSIWGQIDSFLALFMVLAIFLLKKNKFIFSALIFAFALLIKPQAIFFSPIIIIFLLKNKGIKILVNYFLFFIIPLLLLSWPFFPNNPFFGLPKLIIQMGKDYPGTTINAFNFWQLFGNWQNDTLVSFGFTKQTWGLMLFLFFELLILIPLLLRKKNSFSNYLFGIVLCLFNFYLFPTRIHERYLLPMLPFLLTISTGSGISFLFIYLSLSLIHFLNLYYVYNTYYFGLIKFPLFFQLIKFKNMPFILSLFSLVIFILLLFTYYVKLFKNNKNCLISLPKLAKKTMNKIQLKPINIKKLIINHKILLAILFFALITRFWKIGYPQAYVFDEVYHGFTSQEMAKGNKMAWEWWNTPPQGFAYEWTHPPLAKLIMSLSVLGFGKNDQQSQFAFRFPGVIFGTGAIFLTYLLAKEIFKKEKIGLLSAFLLSFDNLFLVMSRTGMADVYFLFFLLLTILLALKKKYFWSAISLGLSIGTKWTGFYLIPVLGIIFLFQLNNKIKKPLISQYLNILISFFLLPSLIYLLCYLPFFTSGHKWSQFVELQKQMWWYHTNLKATHNYQSKAYTWPFMIRPVWFWVNYQENKIANIYNLGNPFLWWTGVTLFPWGSYEMVKKFRKKEGQQLAFIIVCYFAFWLPWVFSPRIMFLHHYLPALPFLFILIAYFLNKIENWEIKGSFITHCYLLITVIIFLFFYPLSTGVALKTTWLKFWFWLFSWR